MYTLNPILLLVAILPGAYLLYFVYKHDRIEPEPKPLLIKCFIFGILSTSAAVITEMIGSYILSYFFTRPTVLYNFLMYFFVVALSEEGFKYLFLKLATWKDEAFDYQFDGIVYAVFIALGFAIKENIMYVSQYGLATGIVRAFTAVPGHASFGVMMGAWYGMAKKYFMLGDQEKYGKYKKYALWIPVILHGLYDFFASSQSELSVIMFFAIVIAMFVMCFKIVKTVSANDNYLNNVRIPNADPDFQYRTIPNEPNVQNVQSRPVNPNGQNVSGNPNVQYRPAEPSAQPRPVEPNVPNRPVEPNVQNRTVDTNSYNRTIDTNDFNRPNGPTQ